MNDWRHMRTLSREEMMKRVARFKKLKGSDGGLPDSPLPECRRKLYAVIGFQPPMERASGAATSPVETFIPMTGRWRCEWNEGEAMEYVDLNPYDVISFPPGVARRFMNVTHEEADKEHLLMFVIGGNSPQAEFTAAAMRRCEEHATAEKKKARART
ncbi:MAG: cupin domain-containing protein [Betaproteobacteria bacterium]|nr:MAG: cupin domain-containing protein [Betaproteobacteria bacterium]